MSLSNVLIDILVNKELEGKKSEVFTIEEQENEKEK